MEKSLLDRTPQLSAYAAWYVEFANTVGIACHFNGSKGKKHNKISGTTTRILRKFCKWTTNIPGMKRPSKYQNEHKEHYQAGDKSRDKQKKTVIRF